MEDKYKVFIVNDYRDYNEIDVILFDLRETRHPEYEDDVIGCTVDTRDLLDDSRYCVNLFNDSNGTAELVSDNERVEIVEVVKKFLVENPIDTIRYGEFY